MFISDVSNTYSTMDLKIENITSENKLILMSLEIKI